MLCYTLDFQGKLLITNILAYIFDQESECTEVLTNLFEMNIHCLEEPYVLYSIHSATTKPSGAFTLWNSRCTVQEQATDPKEEILYIISCKALD